jgi:hypothetical protein
MKKKAPQRITPQTVGKAATEWIGIAEPTVEGSAPEKGSK